MVMPPVDVLGNFTYSLSVKKTIITAAILKQAQSNNSSFNRTYR